MKRALLYAAVAAALGTAGVAHAVATQVNFGFVPIGTFSYTGPTLGASTALDFGASTFTTNTVNMDAPFADDAGSFLGMGVFMSESIFAYTMGATVPFDFTKSFTTNDSGAADSEGLYTALFTSVTAGSDGPDFLNLTFTGSVTGPDGFSAADVMLLNCNQSGGPGFAVNCSFTEQGPPVPTQVPEPATLALVGLAFLGLTSVRRRTR